MKEIKIVLLWGLPGSGKSHYAKEEKEKAYLGETNDRVHITSLDRIKDKNIEALPSYLKDEVEVFLINCFYRKQHKSGERKLIIDGLITTNACAENIIRVISKQLDSKAEHINQGSPVKYSFDIIYWIPDIEACLWNDEGRRKHNSKITIKNTKIEEPSKELIEFFNLSVSMRRVVRKSEAKHWVETSGIDADGDSKTLQSSSWSLGGTSGNCWDSELSTIEPGEPLASFEKFNDLLEILCPNISFKQYKEIYSQCVSIETEWDSDYYGGNTKSAFYSCDLEKLHAILKEKDLLLK